MQSALRSRSLRRLAESALLLAALVLGIASCGQTMLLATTEPAAEGAWLVEGGVGNVPSTLAPYRPAPTLFTYDGRLRDHCGEPLILRGVAELVAWTPGQDGDPEFFQIAKTGGNAVRVMWRDDAYAEQLDQALTEAERQGLVAVVELQATTFTMLPEAEALGQTMAYWTQPAVADVLRAHQQALILELSSWAAASAMPSEWLELYASAIGQLRAFELELPIAVVEPTWASDPTRVASALAELAAGDPRHNVLLAFDVWRVSASVLSDRWAAFREAKVASYISEFSGSQTPDCTGAPADVAAILAVAAQNAGSWFAWSWGAVPNPACPASLTMTTDGTFDTLTGWGLQVALEDPNGLSRMASALGTDAIADCPQ